MSVLPIAPSAYSQIDQQTVRGLVEAALRDVFRTGIDVELGPDTSIIFTAPNGTRHALSVDNAGAAVWTAL